MCKYHKELFLINGCQCCGSVSDLVLQTDWIQSGGSPEVTQQNRFPWSDMPVWYWKGEGLLLNSLGVGVKSFKIQSHIPNLSLWTIKHGAPTVQLLLLLLPVCVCFVAQSKWKSDLTGTYHSPATGEVVSQSEETLQSVFELQALLLPHNSLFCLWSGLRWRGLRGGESRALEKPADQSWGILLPLRGESARLEKS